MKKISVCIDMMFKYCEFLDRISEVKKCGIDTIEFWKWSNKDINKVADSKINVSVFNIDSSNEKLSYDLSRGILNEGRVDDFLIALNESIPIYKKLNASAMIVLIGENKPFNSQNMYNVLNAAKPIVERENVTLIVEPLNNIDRIGYSMSYAKPVFDVLKKIGSPNIKMLYDIYHQNMMGDFSINEIRENIEHIGHFHIADVPGRHEPGTGNVDYVGILREISEMPYDGFIGLEYIATKKDSETVQFLEEI